MTATLIFLGSSGSESGLQVGWAAEGQEVMIPSEEGAEVMLLLEELDLSSGGS
jgi:hypothetical protein